MNADRHPNPWTVLDLFRSGLDTFDIAKKLGTRECLVADALFAARGLERQVQIFGHRKHDVGF